MGKTQNDAYKTLNVKQKVAQAKSHKSHGKVTQKSRKSHKKVTTEKEKEKE